MRAAGADISKRLALGASNMATAKSQPHPFTSRWPNPAVVSDAPRSWAWLLKCASLCATFAWAKRVRLKPATQSPMPTPTVSPRGPGAGALARWRTASAACAKMPAPDKTRAASSRRLPPGVLWPSAGLGRAAKGEPLALTAAAAAVMAKIVAKRPPKFCPPHGGVRPCLASALAWAATNRLGKPRACTVPPSITSAFCLSV